jgi:excisionase family DNA binding protein
MSNALSLSDHLERVGHALTASELSKILAVSPITLYRLAKAGRIPSFRIGSAVRFCPKSIADWLREISLKGAKAPRNSVSEQAGYVSSSLRRGC